MESLGSRASKGRFKSFRNNYFEFWDKLLRDTSETDELFSGLHQEEEDDDETSTSPLFDALFELISMFSGVRARKLRIAATEAGLQLVSSLVRIAKVKAETRDLKQRQLDAEGRKKRPNASMLKKLKEDLMQAQARIQSVESMIKKAFNKIFTHRFRDVDPAVRSTCMISIGSWMREHPLFFLSDYYLKYLGWSLNDKEPRVRLAVLTTLRELYSASSENLALMDTFNARFISRVREMLNDIDPGVAAEAINTLSVLHTAGVLPRGDIEAVVSLLLDADEQVRNAAAAVMPSLITQDSETEGNDSVTLLSIVHIIKGLQGSRARTASTVDAIWNIYNTKLTDWNLIFTMLISEDQDAKKQKSSSAKVTLRSEDAAGLANVLACAVRRARGDQLIRPDSSGGQGTYVSALRPPTKAQREAHEHARESFTQVAMKMLPQVLRRWKSHENVIGPLLETFRNVKLEHYALKHKEAEFEALMDSVVEIFQQQSCRRVLDACANIIHYAVTEGHESLKEVGNRCREKVFMDVKKRLSTAVKAARIESNVDRAKRQQPSFPLPEISDDEGHQFQIRMGLIRLNALVSLLPPPSVTDSSSKIYDVYDDLSTIIEDAASGVSCVGVRSIALAARATSICLVHHMIELVDKHELSSIEVDKHVSVRDAFIANAVVLAGSSLETYPSSRLLPKAVIAAVANLIVFYQHPHVSSADGVQRSEETAALVSQFDLCPAESVVRTIWDTCNHLLDLPEDSSDDDGDIYGNVSGDEEVARLAYCLAMCDISVTNHDFIAPELLANRGHSGLWTDRAISALLVDLRHLGPQAIGVTITTSLVSAYEEVTAGGDEDAAELEEAFRELADRLAGIFVIANSRDRVVVRCIVEEGLKFVVPNSGPDPERMRFLQLGLNSFIPKLASADAKAMLEPLDAVTAVINEEDDMYAPLFEFVNRIGSRARGAVGSGRKMESVPQKRRSMEAGEPAIRSPATDEKQAASEPEESKPAIRVYGRRRR